jgi:hypothetical protein
MSAHTVGLDLRVGEQAVQHGLKLASAGASRTPATACPARRRCPAVPTHPGQSRSPGGLHRGEHRVCAPVPGAGARSSWPRRHPRHTAPTNGHRPPRDRQRVRRRRSGRESVRHRERPPRSPAVRRAPVVARRRQVYPAPRTASSGQGRWPSADSRARTHRAHGPRPTRRALPQPTASAHPRDLVTWEGCPVDQRHPGCRVSCERSKRLSGSGGSGADHQQVKRWCAHVTVLPRDMPR